MRQESASVAHNTETATILDVLERVLDKGIVIYGDIFIDIADIELLKIRLRLVICSVDTAERNGLDWWRRESVFATGGAPDGALARDKAVHPSEADERLATAQADDAAFLALKTENETLRAQLSRVEDRLATIEQIPESSGDA